MGLRKRSAFYGILFSEDDWVRIIKVDICSNKRVMIVKRMFNDLHPERTQLRKKTLRYANACYSMHALIVQRSQRLGTRRIHQIDQLAWHQLHGKAIPVFGLANHDRVDTI